MALTDYTRVGWVCNLCLWNCGRCHSVVTDRELHDDWHEAHANHGHVDSAGYVTFRPVPARMS